MLRNLALAAVACGLVTLAAGDLSPVEAGYGEAAFRAGGLHFRVLYQQGRYGADTFYLRVGHRLPERAGPCGSFCYLEDRHAYHHASCPAARRFLRHYNPHALRLLDRGFHRGRDHDEYYDDEYYDDRGRRGYRRHDDEYRERYRYHRHDDEYRDDPGRRHGARQYRDRGGWRGR